MTYSKENRPAGNGTDLRKNNNRGTYSVPSHTQRSYLNATIPAARVILDVDLRKCEVNHRMLTNQGIKRARGLLSGVDRLPPGAAVRVLVGNLSPTLLIAEVRRVSANHLVQIHAADPACWHEWNSVLNGTPVVDDGWGEVG